MLESLTGRKRTVQRVEKPKVALRREKQPTLPRIQASSLQETVNYGNLLLKHEESELSNITQFANELIQQEKVSPQKPVPCMAEKEACHACYKENATKDVSVCSKVAADFHRCSQSAA